MVDCDFINFIFAVLSVFCTVSVHRFVVSLCCTRRVLIGLKIHVTSGRPRFRGGGEVWGIWRGNTYGEWVCFCGSATPLRCFTLGGWEKIVVDAASGRLWIPLFLEILITDCCVCGSPSWLRLWTRSHSSSWSATHWTAVQWVNEPQCLSFVFKQTLIIPAVKRHSFSNFKQKQILNQNTVFIIEWRVYKHSNDVQLRHFHCLKNCAVSMGFDATL